MASTDKKKNYDNRGHLSDNGWEASLSTANFKSPTQLFFLVLLTVGPPKGSHSNFFGKIKPWRFELEIKLKNSYVGFEFL
jgi:hypothetical protein